MAYWVKVHFTDISRVDQHILQLCDTLQFFSPLQNNAKVAVLGASGGIGQPLSLLLKNSPLVSELSLYDIAHTPGVAADLSHIETRAHVTGTEMVLAQQAP